MYSPAIQSILLVPGASECRTGDTVILIQRYSLPIGRQRHIYIPAANGFVVPGGVVGLALQEKKGYSQRHLLLTYNK